jgi:hypothetical protein
MRGWRTALLSVGAVVVAACAATSTVADPTQPKPRSGAATMGDPARLVGAWHLTAPGEPSTAVLTIGDRVDGGILLFRPCGMLSGSWRANRHGMFVAAIDGGDGACYGDRAAVPNDPAPRWLPEVVGFRRDRTDELLLDAAGHVVARLRPGAHPTVGPNASQQFVAPPVVTEAMRRAWAEPAPLPHGVRPASAADALGRWVPGRRGSLAYVRFDVGGHYAGSDGCNGAGGRYLLGAGGLVIATSGLSTLIGCENSPLPGWVTAAGRLGIRGGQLVFVDPQGKVLGAARRSA